ncbi:MAG: hypothetical protein A2440_06470 [Stygiobacter sp. RIFOXYC2_FULL_38_25]|nr:MAG: hypothetical protein A2440_06470 [Stygiobacter sp. RIFOXYC2_FULL_38_25]OGV79563.1 MAG: hypothetical protein A2X65_18550 [Stygiobacter sp. GWF2_38_21]
MDSLNNFVWDCFIKSFESKDTLIEATSGFSMQEKKTFARCFFENIVLWENIYNNRVNYLLKNVKLIKKNSSIDIDKIEFHHKYGWIIFGGCLKAYLGKSSIYEGVKLGVGNRTYFSGHSTIRGSGYFKVGSFCSIGFGLYVNIANENQPINYPASIGLFNESRMKEDNFVLPFSKVKEVKEAQNTVNIQNDVWIGRNVSIFHNLSIGNGCAIGANSLVTKNCEPFGIYAGIPAKLIRYRFSKRIIEQLLDINWWSWTDEKIHKNQLFFNTDLSSFDGIVNDLIEE